MNTIPIVLHSKGNRVKDKKKYLKNKRKETRTKK